MITIGIVLGVLCLWIQTGVFCLCACNLNYTAIRSKSKVYQWGFALFIFPAVHYIAVYNKIMDYFLKEKYIKALEVYYKLDNPNEIIKFIFDNLFLMALLKEVPAQLKKHFGDVELTLAFSPDPENANLDNLCVYVPYLECSDKNLENKVKERLELFDKFGEEWWLDNINRAKGKLIIL